MDRYPGFNPTRWTLVLAAARGSPTTASRRALDELIRGYWFPVYAHIRRHGFDHPRAEDLTQGFFARLLEKNDLATVDPGKGKFRSFLLASTNHFLCNELDSEHAQKRGGGVKIRPLDTSDALGRYQVEPVDHMTPDLLFQRDWALEVLSQVLSRLREEYVRRNSLALFEGLKNAMAGELDAPSYAQLAQQLTTTPQAVKTAAHRLRARYREILRDEVAQTVADPALVDEEICELRACL